MLSLLSGVGPSSNLRLGDLQDLVVTVVVVVLKVLLAVVFSVLGLTDCSRCCSSFKTSALLVVCWTSGASVGCSTFSCRSSRS